MYLSILLLLACYFPHIFFLPQIRVFTSRGWYETIKTSPMAMEWEEFCWSLVLSLKQDTKTPSGTFKRRRCQRRWNWQVWDLGWYVNSQSMLVMSIGKAGINFIFKSMEIPVGKVNLSHFLKHGNTSPWGSLRKVLEIFSTPALSVLIQR